MYSLNSNIASRYVHYQLDTHTHSAEQTINKVSSGTRHVTAAQDPASLVSSNQLRTTIAAIQEGQRNTSHISSLLQVAAEGLQQTTALMSRMRQLAIQVVNDTLGGEERSLINAEYQRLLGHIDTTAEITRFNGRSLLSGGVASAQVRNTTSMARLSEISRALAGTELVDAADSTFFTAATALDEEKSGGNFTLTVDAATEIRVHSNGDESFSVVVNDGTRVFQTQSAKPGEDRELILTDVQDPDNKIALAYNAGIAAPATAADFKTDLETFFNVAGGGATLTLETESQGFTGDIDTLASRGFLRHTFGAASDIDLTVENSIATLVIDGETFSGSALAQSGGRFTLQSQDNPENAIIFVYAADVSNLQTDEEFSGRLREVLAHGTLSIGGQAELSGIADITSETTASAFSILHPLNAAQSSGIVVGQVTSQDDILVTGSPLVTEGYTVHLVLRGETFHATNVQVEDYQTLTLTSVSNPGNILALNFSGNTEGIQDAATFETQLEGLLNVGVANVEPARFAVGDPAQGLGLNTEQTVFATDINRQFTRGFIDGIVTDATATQTGEAYAISVTIGGQVFQSQSYTPANGLLSLVSLTNPNNVIALDVTDASQLTDAVTFTRILEIYFGIGDFATTNPAQFRSDNGFNDNHNGFKMGIDRAIRPTSSTPPGLYSFSYDRDTQTFHLSNHNSFDTLAYQDVQTEQDGRISLLFDNGLSIVLGDSVARFDPDVGITQTLVQVSSSEMAEVEAQISNEIAEDVIFSLPPATTSALNLVGTEIGTKTSARNVQQRLTLALQTLGISLASIAANQSQLEALQTNSSELINGNTGVYGLYNDIDMAQEITAFTTQQTLAQASVSMLTQANSIPQTLLRLLP